MQLFDARNFVGRGGGRVLLSGSSEVREAFLVDEIETALPGVEVYNNAYSNHTLETFLLVLQYIEAVYGSSAMPQRIVLGITPWFALNDPDIDESYLPRVIDRYSASMRVDKESQPPRLAPKGWNSSVVSRYRLLTHQSRRYRGALKELVRATVTAVAPGFADQYEMQQHLVPSRFHGLEPIDQASQLDELRRFGRTSVVTEERRRTFAAEYAKLREFVTDNEIDLRLVNMPQSTWMVDRYFGNAYDDYRRMLASVVGDTPFLDLSRFLDDDEFYDMSHPTLSGARRVSLRVAEFVQAPE